MLKGSKKNLAIIFLISFMTASLFIYFPRQAKAQGAVSAPAVEAVLVKNTVKQTLGAALVQAGTISLVNALNYFVQKLAYDTATWVASAGPGQKPLFDGRSLGQYLGDVGKSATMKFMTEATDMVGLRELGFDVCSPNLSLLYKVKIGFIKGRFQQPDEPRCDWQTMINNWDAFGSSFKTGEVLKNFGIMFEPGQSDLGFALEFNGKILGQVQTEEDKASQEHLKNGGWQGVKDFISGKVTTPADVVKESFKQSSIVGPNQTQVASWSAFSTALGQGAWQIVPAALSNFTNTLLTKSMERVMTGVFSPFDYGDIDMSIETGDSGSATPAVGRRKAQEVYSDLIKPKITSSESYDPIIEFAACPDKEEEKQINNCVLDESFASAIRLADQGKPVTIADALKEGYLDGSKPLISSMDSRNEQMGCYQQGYCYSNMVKLRKARILPVGFELAAEIKDQGGNGGETSLQTVIDGFNKCNNSGQRDATHPYCHLIDPNWVLKLPKTQCQARVYGPTLVSSAGNLRSEVCADPITCISEDESGKCVGGWGYCTKEKNIWRISADKCSEQFSSCLTYKSRDNKVNNYIKNTGDFAVCNATNVGCHAYAVNQKAGAGVSGLGNEIYFNKDVEKCEAKDAGCTELYPKANGLAYNLIPNPSFENFDSDGRPVNWVVSSRTGFAKDTVNHYDQSASLSITSTTATIFSGQNIKLETNTTYTISAYLKKGDATASSGTIGLFFYPNADGSGQFDATNLLTTCTAIPANLSVTQATNDSFERLSCSFLTPNQTLYAKIFLDKRGGTVSIDAVQLEEGSSATTFLSSGYGNVESANIKIAPSYLNCQAGNTDPQCSGYAPTCKAEEVGCQNYKPTDGSPTISGVININDVCPASCSGYDLYKQDATLFENANYINFLIPSTAKTCTAQEAGCDEFTNLENESKEYFTFVRQCIKPDANQDATFYTWEGSDQAGYQLKSHRLKIEEGTLGNPVPAYVANTDQASCTKDIFKASIGDVNYNPDCREFYNAAGAVSYRLLSKTIISTDQCVEYRKTDSSQFSCEVSGGAWNATSQYCLYKAYKAESKICNAAANGCRAYSGAASSNMRIVLQDDFEANGASGWVGGDISAESLTAGGHSLKVPSANSSNKNISKDLSGLVSANGTYMVSFWAKAPSGGTLQTDFSNAQIAILMDSNNADAKGDWSFFEFGPYNFGDLTGIPYLNVTLTGNSSGFYIDNIIIKEVNEKLYLVKNSWKTPAECDKTINGLFLPQAMLGCKTYTNTANEPVYFKSFGALCRSEAAGCGAFVNTSNSKSEKNKTYNAVCALSDYNGGACTYNGNTVCTVITGKNYCLFDIENSQSAQMQTVLRGGMNERDYMRVLEAKVGIVKNEGTIEVPADQNIYIVDDKKYHCQAKDLGCSALGQGDLYSDSNYTSVYLKNRTENYNNILCSADAEGCESWTSAKGVDYFRVPAAACEYKDSGQGTGGWFKQGKEEACYPGFVQNGVYGIWRNADTNYNGSVGICPENQNTCTEFIDPLDTSSANKTGKPYYLLDNEKLKALSSDDSCSGGASQEEGCVLFNKTSDPNLKWDAKQIYKQAETEKKPVLPTVSYGTCSIIGEGENGESYGYTLSGPGGPQKCLNSNDCPESGLPGEKATCSKEANANTILKVTRDRECGEWLACKSSYTAYDPITNKAKPVCAEMGLCDKYQSGGSSLCANFVVDNPDSGKLLNADNYAARKVGWASYDYSGYSIGGKYPVSDVKIKNISANSNVPDIRLTANEKNLDGTQLNIGNAEKTICRGYPEEDSPYPSSIGRWDINKQLQAIVIQGLKSANICEYGQTCECDYTKLTYGSKASIKYVSYGNRDVSVGICQGGPRDGLKCEPGIDYEDDANNSCGKPEDGGTCLKLQRQDDVIGWSGYCLERDLSTPINGDKNQKACITWMPQDVAPGSRDIYNQFRTAGYIPPTGGGKYYCLQASGNASRVSESKTSWYDNLLVTNSTVEQAMAEQYAILNNREIVPGDMLCGWGSLYYTKTIVGTGLAPVYCPHDCRGSSRSACVRTSGEGGDLTVLPPNLEGDMKDEATLFISNRIGGEEEGGYGVIKTFNNPSVVVDLGPNSDHAFTNPQNGNIAHVSGKDLISKPVYRDDIDLIEIKVLPAQYGAHSAGTVFFIRSDQEATNYVAFGGVCDGKTKKDNCSGESVGTGTLKNQQRAKSLKNGDDWYFRYDAVSGSSNNRDLTDVDLFSMGDSAALEAYCGSVNTGTSRQYANALKFHFNHDTGLLESLSVAYCSSAGHYEDDGKVGYAIYIHKRETCETIVDVASFKNTANTQSLWNDNPKNKANADGNADTSITDGYYHYNYEIRPFGSSSKDTAPSNIKWYSYYTIGQHDFAGVPWACKGDCGAPLKVGFEPMPKNVDTIVLAVDKLSRKTIDSDYKFSTSLGNLFARTFKSYTWDIVTHKYISHDCDPYVSSPTIGCFGIPKNYNASAPLIFSYYPSVQLSNKQYKLGQASKVILNNKFNEDIRIKGNQYSASIRFYAWAASSHMPLKSIKIDWGDGSTIETVDGMYRNHKPICAQTNVSARVCVSATENLEAMCNANSDCPVGYICEQHEAYFGNSKDACDEAYFEFQHTYTCSNSVNEACPSFKPKVTITDNWGISSSASYGGTVIITP